LIRQRKPTSSQRNNLPEEAALPSEEDEDKSSMPRNMSWIDVGMILAGDVIGAGVMSLPSAFAQLGWVLSYVSLIFWYVKLFVFCYFLFYDALLHVLRNYAHLIS
jgi:hypothetical protein